MPATCELANQALETTEIAGANLGSPTLGQTRHDHTSRPGRLPMEETVETGLLQTVITSVKPLARIREVVEEDEVVYPRMPRSTVVPLQQPIPKRSLNVEEPFIEEQLPSSTESSDTHLTNVSNKPLRKAARLRTSDMKPAHPHRDHFKDEAFRMYRPVRGLVPSSDPESFFSGTRTATWHSKREGRFPQRGAHLAWPTASSMRSNSPVIRPGSVVASRNVDQSVVHRYSGNKTFSGTNPGSHPQPLRKSARTHKPETASRTTVKPLDLTGQVERLYDFPSAHGGFADVWIGKWGGITVAVKVLRPPTESEEAKQKLRKRLRRELRVWRGLHHENVLSLYGTTSHFGPYTSMVCPWLENGTLNRYLEGLGNALTLSERFKLLCEIAAGLFYLHSHDVVHGDLTGSNVLIDARGRACLSDFGLSTLIAEFQGTSYFTSSIRGAVRYAAPEIYATPGPDPIPSVRVSTHSDIYSFGSVMLQTLSGKVPYHYLRSDPMVLWELYNGVHPQRPTEPWFTEDHWKFINNCWSQIPRERPTVQDVVSYVQLRYNASFASFGPH